jgi:hypothetical protein
LGIIEFGVLFSLLEKVMRRFSSEERLARAEKDEEFDVTDEEEFIEAVLDAEYKERQLKRRLEDPLGIDSEIEFHPSVLKEREKERRVSVFVSFSKRIGVLGVLSESRKRNAGESTGGKG